MKVAVLADIHGNVPALKVVSKHIEDWQPDAVLLAGDVVNRGPRPLECLRIVQTKMEEDSWQVVRGNHEDYVLKQARPEAPSSGPEFEIDRSAFWTYQQLNGQVSSLKAMPFQVNVFDPDGREVRAVHASMRNNRDGIYVDTIDKDLRQKIAPAPAVICVGHTHKPLIRRIDDTLVINVGSVGMPFDGDKRASYARLTWQNGSWRAELTRLDYDRKQTERDFFSTGFFDGAGELVRIMLLEFRQARAYLHLWIRHYEAAVLAGEISLNTAVDDFLSSVDQ
jgi:predicted phosphodiesterase